MKTSALMMCVLLAVRAGAADDLQVEEPRAGKVVTLSDKRINESSGIARSLRHPGIFWTHNDSGGEPCIFAVNVQGRTVAKVRIPNAANFDWEDITQGLDENDQPCLFIGDIGDNLRIRPTLQIYRIPEPGLPKDPGKEMESAEPEVLHFSYPDGKHNAEALMMHPQSRQLYILTKQEKGRSMLYKLPSARAPGRALTLEKVLPLTFPERQRLGKQPSRACLTTAGDFSPDGRRLVIATYSYLHEWELPPGEPLAQALLRPARLIKPPLTRGMEAACYDPDSASLWITSEVLPTPLHRIGRK